LKTAAAGGPPKRMNSFAGWQRRIAARELANIVEEVTPTTWGSFCIGMVVLTAIGAFFAFSAATTVFQQIEAGVVWIGGTIMFGIGAMMNQKRTYTVYRSVHRTE